MYTPTTTVTFLGLLLSFFFLAQLAAATSVTFINQCSYPLHYWLVGPGFATADKDGVTVPSHANQTHTLLDGGNSIKFRDRPHYQTSPAGIAQFEYNLDNGKTWYDLSLIDCNNKNNDPKDPLYCPFLAGGIRVFTSAPHLDGQAPVCGKPHCMWPGGSCDLTYLEHGSWALEPSLVCDAKYDLFVETCSEGDGVQSYDGDTEVLEQIGRASCRERVF